MLLPRYMTVILLILTLVILPAAIGFGFCLESQRAADNAAGLWSRLFRDNWHPGDFLIYRKPKVSSHPGPRARNIQAAENGDSYYYEVDKFWALSDVMDDGRLLAVTRTGKRVYLSPEDERLHRAGWLARVRYRDRFPAV